MLKLKKRIKKKVKFTREKIYLAQLISQVNQLACISDSIPTPSLNSCLCPILKILMPDPVFYLPKLRPVWRLILLQKKLFYRSEFDFHLVSDYFHQMNTRIQDQYLNTHEADSLYCNDYEKCDFYLTN